MYHAYIDLMERAHEFDVALARTQARRENKRARLQSCAFSMSNRKFIKRYRLSKDLARQLIKELSPHMPPTLRSDAMDVETKLSDSNLNRYMDASYPGSSHDCCVGQYYPLHPYLKRLHRINGEDLYLLGDSGLRATMMMPTSEPEPDTPEEYYQNLHLSTRSSVERCIGVLKGRFRCLLMDRKLHYSPQMAVKITNACCVLHNIAHRANMFKVASRLFAKLHEAKCSPKLTEVRSTCPHYY